VDPDITLAAYAERWLGLLAASVKSRTVEGHRYAVTHLLPALGSVKIRRLHKGQFKAFLVQKLAAGLSRATVRILYSTLRALLHAAVDDGVLLANPATRLERKPRVVAPPTTRQEEIKAMDRDQLRAFLGAASTHARRSYPLFLTLARTGLRLGEGLALQWENLDFSRRKLRVARAFSAGRP